MISNRAFGQLGSLGNLGSFSTSGSGGSGQPRPCCQYSAVSYTWDFPTFLTHYYPLTGIAGSPKFFFAAWLRMDPGSDDTGCYIFADFDATEENFTIARNVDNKITIVWLDSDFNAIVVDTVIEFKETDGYKLLMISVDSTDFTNPVIKVSLNNTVEIATPAFNNLTASTIPFNLWDGWRVGTSIFGDNIWRGDMGMLFFMAGEAPDLENDAFRAKFISLSGNPVCPGSFGEKPFGTAPDVYLYQAYGDTDVTSFPINNGTGGDFTVSGVAVDTDPPTTIGGALQISYTQPPTACVNIPGAVYFNANNQYLLRNSEISATNQNKLFISCFASEFSDDMWLLSGGSVASSSTGAQISLFRGADNRLHVLVESADSPDQFIEWRGSVDIDLTLPFLVRWFAVSIQTFPTLECQICTDGVVETGVVVANSFGAPGPMNLSNMYAPIEPKWQIGRVSLLNGTYGGRIGEVFVWAGNNYWDLSDSGTQATFRDPTTLKPVYLGVDGSLAFGDPALIYLHAQNSKSTLNSAIDNCCPVAGGGFTEAGSPVVTQLYY